MSMLESFFSIQRGDSRDVFEGLNIMKHDAFCAEWMNQYPVLFLTLKGVEALSFDEAYETLKVKLSELCILHRDLLNNPNVAEVDKSTFQKLMDKRAELAEIKDSLKQMIVQEEIMKLIERLSKQFNVERFNEDGNSRKRNAARGRSAEGS